jgi:Conserved region of Rad21 / Rec8 like protein
MLNPESFRRQEKRKRIDEITSTPKKARVEPTATALEEQGFGDGGFGDDGGFADTGFGDGGFGDNFGDGFGDTNMEQFSPIRERRNTPTPSVISELPVIEDEEQPTSITGSLSHSTLIAAQHLQSHLQVGTTRSLNELTSTAVSGKVRREDAVKMFFEVLVLASRDAIRVEQRSGFGEISVRGKEGLWKGLGEEIVV